MTGTTGSQNRPSAGLLYQNDRPNEATAYARVTVPLGPRPQRINCAQVFELEIAKLKREVELLRMGVR